MMKPVWKPSAGVLLSSVYCNNPKYWDCANSVDPDQMPQNVASDQGLHCLQPISSISDTSSSSRKGSVKVFDKYCRQFRCPNT